MAEEGTTVSNCVFPIAVAIPYSGLFSLGANFPKFHKWAYYTRENLFWAAT